MWCLNGSFEVRDVALGNRFEINAKGVVLAGRWGLLFALI
jgi:hypothetical protein